MLFESAATEMIGLFGSLRRQVVNFLWRDSIDSGVAEVD